MENYDYWKPVKLTTENAKALTDLYKKRELAIKARQNAYLHTKHTFDKRKNFFQTYKDLENSYKQISKKLKILESETDVQKYIQLLDFYTNLLSEKIVLTEDSNIERLFYEINILLENSNIIEYICLKNDLKNIEKELLSVRGKVIEELTKYKESLLCPHPLYAALNNEAYCILCKNKLKYYHDDFKYLSELIKSKRLIADVDYHVASYSSKVNDVFYKLKEIVPLDEVSNYYKEMKSNRHKLFQEGSINDEYSLEDYVWDHFCLERKPIVHQYRKNFNFN